MKYTILIIFILAGIHSFSQKSSYKLNFKSDFISEIKPFTLLSENNNSLNFSSQLSLSDKKSFVLVKDNQKYLNNLNLFKNKPKAYKTCMWIWAAPIISGVMFYNSYTSFKDGNKTDGYVGLGIGTAVLIGTVIYIFI